MDKVPLLPPLPPTEAFLPFPGEPDKAAEARLRGALRGFRAAATNLEHVQMLAHEPQKHLYKHFSLQVGTLHRKVTNQATLKS